MRIPKRQRKKEKTAENVESRKKQKLLPLRHLPRRVFFSGIAVSLREQTLRLTGPAVYGKPYTRAKNNKSINNQSLARSLSVLSSPAPAHYNRRHILPSGQVILCISSFYFETPCIHSSPLMKIVPIV